MPYHDCITRNLPLFSPPGLKVSLLRTGDRNVLFQLVGADRSFFMTSDWPGIFAYEKNAHQVRRLFAEAYHVAAHR